MRVRQRWTSPRWSHSLHLASGQTTGNSGKEALDEFEDRSPLLALDGIGIYERTRLAEEGITSIQALARHDLVDLMLSSRIPASRLIDWVDQALLYQHVTTADRRLLRNAGIRTATELIGASRTVHGRDQLIRQLRDNGSRLPLILGALRGDEWLTYILHWRAHDDTQEPGRIIYTDRGLQPEPVPVGRNGSAPAPAARPASPTLAGFREAGVLADGDR